jgi:AP endonuclease-1
MLTDHTAGTAIFSKHEPLSVDKTLPGHPNATIWKGRIITLEFPTFYIVGTYVVNAGEGLKVHSMIPGRDLYTNGVIRPSEKRKNGTNT